MTKQIQEEIEIERRKGREIHRGRQLAKESWRGGKTDKVRRKNTQRQWQRHKAKQEGRKEEAECL